MRLTTFASGSGGNCALVSCGHTHLLIDAGISMRRIGSGLFCAGLGWEDITAILITHEHSDHIAGLPMTVKYHKIPVYAPPYVARRLENKLPALADALRVLLPEAPLSLGEVRVTPIPTSHDTDGSVGYLLEGDARLGFCTDTGTVTPAMERLLPGCQAVLLEANHDVMMLRYGPYPVSLKRRILSDLGHLSNDDCAAFVCTLVRAGATKLILGHLSRENNTPDTALETVRTALEEAGLADRAELWAAPPEETLTVEVTGC